MKFNQFVALSEHLEKEGTNINEFVKDITGKPLFERTIPASGADDIETENNRIRLTRFSIIRNKLNKIAKKMLADGNEQIIAKYTPKILASIKGITNSAVALSAEGKKPQEINKLLGDQVKAVQKDQNQAISMLKEQLGKLMSIYNTRIEKIIGKNELSDKNVSKLQAYWLVLETQVQQVFFKKMVGAREDFVNKLAKNDSELAKAIKELTGGKNWLLAIEKLKKKQQDEIDRYRASTGTGEDTGPEPGKIYQWTGPKGGLIKVKIIEKTKDGKWKLGYGPKFEKIKEVEQKDIDEKLGKEVK